jgi:hypothetical protein
MRCSASASWTRGLHPRRLLARRSGTETARVAEQPFVRRFLTGLCRVIGALFSIGLFK